MKIAVLGAGFAGLSVAYFLTQYSVGRCRIDLYDPEPIGMGPSGTALGLLHPYMGRKAMRSWQADSCLERAHQLISVSANAINQPVVISKGVLRPTSKPEQAELFKQRAEERDDLEWWTHDASQSVMPGLSIPPGGGCLYVKEGLTLNVPVYLQGLFRACLTHGVLFKQMQGLTPQILEEYDSLVVCLGANALGFDDFKHLPMTPIKGQVLQLKWPKELPPLPMSLVGDKQIVMAPDQESCWVGATYERQFTDFSAHKEQAWEQIMPKITEFFPALEKAEILQCRAAFRASPKERFPLAGKHGKFWFLTGFGSRGLLYHAWLGRRLALCIMKDDTKYLPREVHHNLQVPG